MADGIKDLAGMEGIFTEPAGGVVIATLKRLALTGQIRPEETTVAFITGNGYKTREVVEHVANPVLIKPSRTLRLTTPTPHRLKYSRAWNTTNWYVSTTLIECSPSRRGNRPYLTFSTPSVNSATN